MADAEQLAILKQGVRIWNQWRRENRDVNIDLKQADLSKTDLQNAMLNAADLRWATIREANFRGADLGAADLRGADLSGTYLRGTYLRGADLSGVILNGADLSRADLRGADLSRADLRDAELNEAELNEVDLNEADLRGADLSKADFTRAHLASADLTGANLTGANLEEADLSGAILRGADLNGADLSSAELNWADLSGAILNGVHLTGADLTGADLSKVHLNSADLSRAILIETNFEHADITGCRIFGISAWKLLNTANLKASSNLIITDVNEPEVTIDGNIEVAQFVYLLLHNEKIRDVISTIGQKAVLILGRFALPERKAILEAMRNKLRAQGYLPIVFDFEKSEQRDFTETIQVLAGMCLFVIADITNPKSSPLELQATVPNYMIPFAPIIQAGEYPFAMFVDLQHKYKWVLDARQYQDEADLIANFERGIIQPALEKHNQLLIEKNEALRIKGIGE